MDAILIRYRRNFLGSDRNLVTQSAKVEGSPSGHGQGAFHVACHASTAAHRDRDRYGFIPDTRRAPRHSARLFMMKKINAETIG